MWIDGELTHAIRKTPRFSGDDERIDGPFPIADDERDVALAALAPYVDRILYGRVDLARDASGRPMVMELELIEPSLFLARHPPALDRFIRGLAAASLGSASIVHAPYQNRSLPDTRITRAAGQRASQHGLVGGGERVRLVGQARSGRRRAHAPRRA